MGDVLPVTCAASSCAVAGAVVTPDSLREKGLVQGAARPVKVLARGDIGKALTVRAHKFSGKAAEKIAAAGGQAEALA